MTPTDATAAPPNSGNVGAVNGNPLAVWWEADCGALHLEWDPVTVEFHCTWAKPE